MIHFLRITLLLWRTYLVRVLLTKRMALVALGCLVPPLFAWFSVYGARRQVWPIEAFMYPSLFLVLQVVVPLAAVIAGSAVIAEELEDRTITYLLTRPIARASILIGRWLATLTILLVLVGTSVGATGAVVEHAAATFVPRAPETIELPSHHGRPARTRVINEPPPEVLAKAMVDGELPDGMLASVLLAALLGAAVYSALFAAIGTFNKHPMIIGLGYSFAIEGFLANLPGTSQTWTIQYYLRSLLLARHAELWSALEDVPPFKFDTTQEAVTTLAVVLVLALAAGSLTISRKQYVLSA